MNYWVDSGNYGRQVQMSSDIGELQGLLRESRDETRSWIDYAQKLENAVIDLASQLSATYQLADNMIKAANGEEVVGGNKILAPDGADLRKHLLDNAANQSKTGMLEAHKDRAKEQGKESNTKSHMIKMMCLPDAEKFPGKKYYEALIRMRPANGQLPDIKQMQQLLLEIGPELQATNNLVLRMLAEANGQDVPEKLLPAGNHEERHAFLKTRILESRAGMIGATVADMKTKVSSSVAGSMVANQLQKITKVVGPIVPPVRSSNL